MLKPGLRRVWRDRETLQLGLDPSRAVVLTGLDRALAEVLDNLTGVYTEDSLTTFGRTRGVDDATTRKLLRILADSGLLEDADRSFGVLRSLSGRERERLQPDVAASELAATRRPVPAFARRRRSTVLVHGAGRVGASVATLLGSAGIGRIAVIDPALATPADLAPAGLQDADLGLPRAVGTTRAVTAAAPSTATARAKLGAVRPDVVVVAPDEEPDRELGHVLVRHAVPHLVVRAWEARAVLGPFVQPGATSCLRCHDLHRADRDPAWPHLLAQILTAGPAVHACDAVLATTVAGMAALHVLAYLDGEPVPSQDATIELTLPFATTRRRSWTPHPRCGCQWDHLTSASLAS